MMPVILSWGRMTFFSLGFWLAIGFLFFAFIAWRRLRDLGLEEEKVLDVILLMAFLGFTVARLSYIFEHLDQFGFNFNKWLFLGRYPGLSFWGGIFGSVIGFSIFSVKKRWDFLRTADELVYSLLPLMILAQVGAFFDGEGIGKPTSLPWGIFFPGDLVRRAPVSLFFALGLLIIWLLFLKIERNWRGWAWYPSQASGLPTLIFVFLASFLNFFLVFSREIPVYWLLVEAGASLFCLLTSGIIIFLKSGLRKKNVKKES